MKTLNPKGMLAKRFLKKMDDKAQFDVNNYGANFLGLDTGAKPYKDDGMLGGIPDLPTMSFKRMMKKKKK